MNQTSDQFPGQSPGQSLEQSFPNSPDNLRVYLRSLAPDATPVGHTWMYKQCRFKFITKIEGDRVVEARYGGKLSCPICPHAKEVTNLSNLLGHICGKDHGLSYYQIQTLAREGDQAAKELYDFYETWEFRNHLRKLKAQRMRKNMNPAVANWSWEKTKEKFKCVETYTTRDWNEIRERGRRGFAAKCREGELGQQPTNPVGVAKGHAAGEDAQGNEPVAGTAIITTAVGGQKKVSNAFKKGKPNTGTPRGEKRKAGPTEGEGPSGKRAKISGARPFASPGGRRGKGRSKRAEYVPPPPPGSPPRTPPGGRVAAGGIEGPHSAPY
ncbi:hypothetical protein AA313_de0200832 [Arthrobotrys entomopaga]|nr:hypothetical protein AA313_de0200832 [Arthrobotrys entomopaga]